MRIAQSDRAKIDVSLGNESWKWSDKEQPTSDISELLLKQLNEFFEAAILNIEMNRLSIKNIIESYIFLWG